MIFLPGHCDVVQILMMYRLNFSSYNNLHIINFQSVWILNCFCFSYGYKCITLLWNNNNFTLNNWRGEFYTYIATVLIYLYIMFVIHFKSVCYKMSLKYQYVSDLNRQKNDFKKKKPRWWKIIYSGFRK